MEKEIVDALGNISDHIVASGKIAVGDGFQDLKKSLSGKKIKIEIPGLSAPIFITLPDLTT